jgi:anaerobic ribonucleoside-triphosphate reductase
VLLDTQKQAKLKNVDKTVGENVGFERTRRITGYLVGTLDRFNNAKRAEERDRVKHATE